ncbi:hypothetical protein O181_038461 [Austropuccinia psidii MF-1]|uniref:Reverse transcriptase domain-containing protein n=1 Tax=Austropuccinia psidii MF-1 TaxID=1389203 RepID=A0A9Q3HBN5_9BASI|nr:hypothetical protein [Austropuccinia psidii MF-1]
MVELPSFPSFEWGFLVIDTPKGEHLILGFEFLNHFHPSIDWRQGQITFNADHKEDSDPSKSFRNEFSSSKACAALLWDEEEEAEEVETVMKVVPCVYHQNVDVFFKVKVEKLPPDCACDLHIELAGSLPPVGVIYSLSKQESDTLRAYISENVEKGFIQPRSSSTGVPVAFVKKKDGGLHLCVDYRKLNAVPRKNKYPLPPMNQLLNVFNGSSIFSKIDLRGAYNLLRIKEGD